MPDAEAAIPAMARLVRWAEERGVTHLATADDHELTDPELSDEPDFAVDLPTPLPARHPRSDEDRRDASSAIPLPLSLTPYPPGHLPGSSSMAAESSSC